MVIILNGVPKSTCFYGLALACLVGSCVWAFAQGNIDATDKYAWAENFGWHNYAPSHGGVTVHPDGENGYLSGHAWTESVGWVKLGADTGPYANTAANNYGINMDANGNLSGYAWSENAGWINFNPTHSQVTIDLNTGRFEGYAWNEFGGWISFKNDSPAYNVRMVLDTIATPAFNPDGGAHPGDSVDVTITCATEGATIRYTTNGNDPTESCPEVDCGSSVPVSIPGTLKAKAWKDGMNPSAVKSATYLQVAPSAPTGVTATEGTYTDKIRITWNAVDGATSYEVWRHPSNDSGSAKRIASGFAETSYDDFDAPGHTTYYYWIKAVNVAGTSGFSEAAVGRRRLPPQSDFTGDSQSETVLYEESTGTWRIQFEDGSESSTDFGGQGYTPVPADYDGDGRTDFAVYHEESGYWYMLLSGSNYELAYLKFGEPGYAPVPGDYDGDGKADLAVYHEATGYWFMLLSASDYELAYLKFGEPGYVPVSGDFDGDGKTDLAVYHEATGYWFMLLSGSNYELAYMKFGEPGYTPVSGDFDGDGKTDIAVYHEATGYWFMLLSGSNYEFSYLKFGEPGYTPVPGDYDGDGITDLAVYHEESGYWFMLLSGSDYALSYQQFGGPGYVPVR